MHEQTAVETIPQLGIAPRERTVRAIPDLITCFTGSLFFALSLATALCHLL